MIARTPEQPLQDALPVESVASSCVACVEPGEHRGTDERPVADGSPSWGVLTSVSASAVAGWRSEQRWSALARQHAGQQRSPSCLLAVEHYWHHAIPGCGFARLHCRQCGREVVVPIFLKGARLLPFVQDVPPCRHGSVPERWRPACRAAPATRAAASGLAARRARLMRGRLAAAHSCRRSAVVPIAAGRRTQGPDPLARMRRCSR